ncbi:hypothetical protein [Bacillus alveayuensis]|uniref:hypothetical protein n=1 Tax=Aeribacillus alveayuensis TaxID=279215 RepID=UPI0005CCCA2C|nr:hypothetical protein [Bacillus alveayuensis]
MVPKTIEELNQIREECRTMVKKRASASAIAAAIPVPGVDISADVGIMLELLPAINRKFGLTPEQIEQLDEETKRIILVLVTSIGSELVGRTITKQLVAKLLKKVGARVAAKQATKYVPFIGQAVSAGISFAAMRHLGNAHIDECYEVAKRYIEETQLVNKE